MLEEIVSFKKDLNSKQLLKNKKLEAIVKWPGGKEKELNKIIPNLPKSFKNYYEPFVGGGAVYTAMKADKYFINDKSFELINLYKIISSDKRAYFFQVIEDTIDNWNRTKNFVEDNATFFIRLFLNFSNESLNEEELKLQIKKRVYANLNIFNSFFLKYFPHNKDNFIQELNINLMRKLSRMKVLEKERGKLPEKDILDNVEAAVKSAFYMQLRYLFNFSKEYKLDKTLHTVIFLFIRNYAYSGMFRYNSKGKFNVPYGGIAYNSKNFIKKIEYLKSDRLLSLLSKTNIESLDFLDFFELHPPSKDDFIFLDPPYDTEFSTYAQNTFGKADQKRLATYLINDCRGKWMIIIKNTDFIFDLYSRPKINISTFDKTYLVSFMNRNNKKTEHLLITNY